MKKLLGFVLCFVLMLGVSVVLARTNEEIKVFLNDEQLEFDASSVIINGTTFVPMRAIFEALGATLEWDGGTQQVTAEKDGNKISMQIGNSLAKAYGIDVPLNDPAQLIDGKTFVPLRFVGESLGCEV